MEQQIQIAVARADLILVTIANSMPKVLAAFAVGFIIGKVVLRCSGK